MQIQIFVHRVRIVIHPILLADSQVSNRILAQPSRIAQKKGW